MAASANAVCRLLQLPDCLLGSICGMLESRADRRAFMHTCKGLHDNTECLSKITTLTLFTAYEVTHGTLQRQLGTVIQGNSITTMIINHSHNHYRDVDVVPLITAAFPLEANRPLLMSRITHLELNDCCISGSRATDLTDCLHSCLPSLRHLTVRRPKFLEFGDFTPFSRLVNLRSFHLLNYGMGCPPGMSTCIANWPHLSELRVGRLPSVGFMSDTIRILHLCSCNVEALPTRLALPSLAQLTLDAVEFRGLDADARARARAAATLAALHGVSFECETLEVYEEFGGHSVSSCAGLLGVLSTSPCCVPAGVQRIVCDGMSFQEDQLATLASMFREVKELFFRSCHFFSLCECVLGFHKLTSLVVHGLQNGMQGSTSPFEFFLDGVLGACTAAQASRARGSEMLTISFWRKHHGYGLNARQFEGLSSIEEAVEERLSEVGEPAKVSLLIL